MRGNHTSHGRGNGNPLYTLFLCLVAAVFVLLITVIVLAVKLHGANKQLRAQDPGQIEVVVDEKDKDKENDGPVQEKEPAKPVIDPIEGEDGPARPSVLTDDDDTKPDTKPDASTPSWINLNGHTEIKVKPKTFNKQPVTQYTTGTVNLRSGPGTSYSTIQTSAKGAAVKVAATENGWAFVSYGNSYGWMSTDYLSSSSAQATSGNLKR